MTTDNILNKNGFTRPDGTVDPLAYQGAVVDLVMDSLSKPQRTVCPDCLGYSPDGFTCRKCFDSDPGNHEREDNYNTAIDEDGGCE